MTWTDITRGEYTRNGLRYPSDMTDREYEALAEWLPERAATGRPRQTDIREVVNAIFYCLRTGCQWRLLPKDFPAWQTVYGYYRRWLRNGTWQALHDSLYRALRLCKGRKARPTAGILDSQSVRSSEAGGQAGYDAFKKIKGRKRHIMVDTQGLLIVCHMQTANVQDRFGGIAVATAAKAKFKSLRHVFADAGYQGPIFAAAFAAIGNWSLEIVKRPDPRSIRARPSFTVLPRRWVVERSFAWLNRHRRLTRDFEKILAHSQAYCFIAMTGIMLRQLARV